ncbi:MAG: phage tail protein [Desulfovibrionaceae bacterium]
MAKVMMALGDFRFSLDTAAYEKLVRTHAWQWAEQPRHGRKPGLQFVGEEVETVELEGRIYPAYKGGLGQIDAMRTEAGKGKPLILVDGTGKTWGKYVIQRITETQAVFVTGGAPLRQDFRLQLARYGEDA